MPGSFPRIYQCCVSRGMEEQKVPHLIEEIQRRPAIWDKTSIEYRNKNFLGLEWNKVAATVKVAKSVAQQKWRALVKKFKTEHTRVQFHRSGDGLDDIYMSKWPYYSSLLFIANSIIPNSSTGNFDCLFEEKPTVQRAASESDICPDSVNLTSLENCCPLRNKINYTMSKNQSEIAEQILRMENEKKSLLECSKKNVLADDVVEQDKLNMGFFQTLLPILREVSKEDILLCRNDVSRVIFSYAYKGTSWKSLNDPDKQGPTRSKRIRLDDEDDCQIVSYIPPRLNSKLAIKVEKEEKKYEPSTREREIERWNCNKSEVVKPLLRYHRYGHHSPSQWNHQHYEQYPGQHNFQHTGHQNRHIEGTIPRGILSNITSSSTVVNFDAAHRTNASLCSGQQRDFQYDKENLCINNTGPRTNTSTGLSMKIQPTAHSSHTSYMRTHNRSMNIDAREGLHESQSENYNVPINESLSLPPANDEWGTDTITDAVNLSLNG